MGQVLRGLALDRVSESLSYRASFGEGRNSMTMTGDEMHQLTDELRSALIAKGRAASDADDIVFVAAEAARDSMQRLIEVVGTAPEGNPSNYAMLYLVPPNGPSYASDQEFLDAVRRSRRQPRAGR